MEPKHQCGWTRLVNVIITVIIVIIVIIVAIITIIIITVAVVVLIMKKTGWADSEGLSDQNTFKEMLRHLQKNQLKKVKVRCVTSHVKFSDLFCLLQIHHYALLIGSLMVHNTDSSYGCYTTEAGGVSSCRHHFFSTS